jgi:hypothetical protein
LISETVPALPTAREVSGWLSSGITLGRDLSVERFDEDVLGQFRAEPEAGVADQANEIWMAAEQLDTLLLAKAQLAEPHRHFGRAIKPFDADGGAGDDAAQRTDERVGTTALFRTCYDRFVH